MGFWDDSLRSNHQHFKSKHYERGSNMSITQWWEQGQKVQGLALGGKAKTKAQGHAQGQGLGFKAKNFGHRPRPRPNIPGIRPNKQVSVFCSICKCTAAVCYIGAPCQYYCGGDKSGFNVTLKWVVVRGQVPCSGIGYPCWNLSLPCSILDLPHSAPCR